MSLVSQQNPAHPPPEYKNSTVLFSFHVKKVTLKPWVSKYLDAVPLRLKWEIGSSERDLGAGEQVPALLTRWESETFKLEGSQAANADTVFLLAQTIREDDCLVLSGGSLKVSLVIDNSTNVLVGASSRSLDQFKVRSRFNPHSFELSNESGMFIGYVDIFYVSQQRWVRINRASLPMINKKETEYTSSPESGVNTASESERRSDDDSTLSCSSAGDASPFSPPPREDYVLIFWNSTNTCFVKSNPNDIQLQLLFMFIKSCLIDGDSPNSAIPFELADIRPDEPFQVLKSFAPNLKPLSYGDARRLMHIPNSQRTSSRSGPESLDAQEDARTTTTEESAFEIQHSSRLYSASVPSTERLLSDANISDPASFYNFIARQNKHFQSLLSKRFLSPTSSLRTGSSGSERAELAQASKKTKYVPLTESFGDASTRYNSLPAFSKSIDSVSSFNDTTHKTTNTMTTALASLTGPGAAGVDEESLTIGDATATTAKTLTTRTFQDKYGQATCKTSLYDIQEDGLGLFAKEAEIPRPADPAKTTKTAKAEEDVLEAADPERPKPESAELLEPALEPPEDASQGPAQSKKSDEFVTPSKGSITVYSIFSPRDYMEGFSEPSESGESELGPESPPAHSLSPARPSAPLPEREAYLPADEKNQKIDRYFKNVQHAYYLHDPEPDPASLLSGFGGSAPLRVNRSLHCERTLLNFETISKDLQTIGELKSSTDPELGSFDSSLIFRALQDAQVLKVQGQALPTSAYLKFFLRYLRCYSLRRVPIVVYLQIITQKQLETMNRLCSTSEEILNFTNVALEALIYELQVSTGLNPALSGASRGLLFHKGGASASGSESESDLFLFESESEHVDLDEFDVDSLVSGDRHLVLHEAVADIAREAQKLDSRSLVYLARLNSPPVKSRGCIFRLAALKIVVYRLFCGRRKFLSNGHVVKL